jgi:hypothetical protein
MSVGKMFFDQKDVEPIYQLQIVLKKSYLIFLQFALFRDKLERLSS